MQNAAISDTALCQAVRDANRRLIAADLGGGVLKQRIARSGQHIGWLSDTDCLQCRYAGDLRSRFREKDNIKRDEPVALKKLAAEFLAYDDKTLARLLAAGVLVEVNCDEKTVP